MVQRAGAPASTVGGALGLLKTPPPPPGVPPERESEESLQTRGEQRTQRGDAAAAAVE